MNKRDLHLVDTIMVATAECINVAYPGVSAADKAHIASRVSARVLGLTMLVAMQMNLDCRENVIEQMVGSTEFAESLGYDMTVRVSRREGK